MKLSRRSPTTGRRSRRILGLAATALLLGGVAGAAVTRAVASSPDTTVSGCFDMKTGALRVLTAGNPTCTATETPLTWNQGQAATRWYRDWDGDGYGDWYRFLDSPAQPPGYVDNNSDCNDNDPTTNPGQKTDPGPGDRNCDGYEAEDRMITWYRDADGDGWGNSAVTAKAPMSAQPKGYVYRHGDCNDADAKIHPYQTGCHANGDIDGDGHRGVQVGGDDCNDMDAHEYPGNTEVVDKWGHDEDCDPTTGGELGYDPNYLDPRPRPSTGYIGLYLNRSFGPQGQLRTFTPPPTSTPEDCTDYTSPDYPRTICRGIWSAPPLYTN